MWQRIRLEKILFLDIETVPIAPSYEQLSSTMQKFWDKKSRFLVKDDQLPAEVYERAGIYAEFGKIVCIAFGIFVEKEGKRTIRIKSISGDDERALLVEFAAMLERHYSAEGYYLCAHNGKEFDFPFLARRLLINNIQLPTILNVSGFKPWETPFLDTLELWKFGDYKHYTSLDLLAYLFGITSPKNDMDGSMVSKVYWEDHDLPRIETYCRSDVLTLMQLFLRFRGEPLVEPEFVEEIKK
ncbi:MAG: 3'-5' exonuclease [Bacteroidales bacterium]|nr:3'-5' exonuclease [Bacteroidales bacterium]